MGRPAVCPLPLCASVCFCLRHPDPQCVAASSAVPPAVACYLMHCCATALPRLQGAPRASLAAIAAIGSGRRQPRQPLQPAVDSPAAAAAAAAGPRLAALAGRHAVARRLPSVLLQVFSSIGTAPVAWRQEVPANQPFMRWQPDAQRWQLVRSDT